MEITIRSEGTVTIVTIVAISGSIDGLTAGDLLGSMGAEVQKGNARLVADFSGVDYISSAGLRALLATMKDARQKGGDLRLAHVRPEVSKVLDLSGFTSILKLYADAASATASFGG